jgi:hypothetical protein
MMEAVSTSEMSVTFYQITWHIQEDSHLDTCCHENLKFHRKTTVKVILTKHEQYGSYDILVGHHP